jgi:hypothetical protein
MAKRPALTNSPVRLAKTTLAIAQKALPTYSAVKSRHDFTQAQLIAVLALRQFFRTDYRGIQQILCEFSDLRKEIGLSKVPHYTTIQKAQQRLLKKGLGTESKLPFLTMPQLQD